jgi:plastocyanin
MLTRKTGPVLATLIGALMATACGSNGYGTTAPLPPGNTVAATASLTFTPGTLPVNVGDVVTFAFGSVPHNVFFTQQAGVPADIAGNNANVSITRTFATAGRYAYTCHIHPAMQGTIEVR